MAQGWIHEHAMMDDSVPNRAIQDDAVTGAKILDGEISVDKLSAALLGYLLPVGRIDYSGMSYCKVG